ncbi:hypothetical protein PIB30_087870, partial [Stylosanthes scabra]|nr:hypothetical protein [Stylosanthes scabra]
VKHETEGEPLDKRSHQRKRRKALGVASLDELDVLVTDGGYRDYFCDELVVVMDLPAAR